MWEPGDQGEHNPFHLTSSDSSASFPLLKGKLRHKRDVAGLEDEVGW